MKFKRIKYFKRENWHFYTLFSFFIGIWCLASVILFANIVISSFKTNIDILSHPWALPSKIVLTNFIKLFNNGFMRYYLNSVIVLVVSIFMILVLSVPAAYGLGKFKFKGNSALRYYFLFGLMFPIQLGIIPLFNLMKTLHLINTLWSIIIVYSVMIPIPIYILTNFVQGVPDALREAASIDGASEFMIFTRIFLPIMRPVITALIPLSAVGIWNEFFIPLVFISNENYKTLPLGLLQYYTSKGFDLSKIGIEFAAMAISIVPLLLLYIFGSKYIISGLVEGAVK